MYLVFLSYFISMDCDDCVTLSDDDNVVEVAKSNIHNSTLHKRFSSMETIILDEDIVDNNSNNIIEIPDSQGQDDEEFVKRIQKIHKQNKLFALFIDKCLDLDNSDGMMRIIERSVLTSFEQCDHVYTSSAKFSEVVTKAMRNLDTDAAHKFSHVKSVVDVLKCNKLKKRVQFITLESNLRDRRRSVQPPRLPDLCSNSISLDSDEDKDEVICLDEEIDAEKENQKRRDNLNVINNSLPNSQESFLVPQVEMPFQLSQEVIMTTVPIEYDPPHETVNDKRIKELELHIDTFKKHILYLEQQEVVDDSIISPYVLCESYKARIVKLYEELCTLVGKQPVKIRKVRLKVLEGHPPGPVKRLELFINSNISQDGSPMFPDFCDVVKCVMVANVEDNLRWTKQQVMREASALFTQCGRALQKKRQKREYRDLLARVGGDQEQRDPADSDPELLRKLEANRRIAVRRERDLIEKFAQLQDQPKPKSLGKPLSRIGLNVESLARSADIHHMSNNYSLQELPCVDPVIQISVTSDNTKIDTPKSNSQSNVKETSTSRKGIVLPNVTIQELPAVIQKSISSDVTAINATESNNLESAVKESSLSNGNLVVSIVNTEKVNGVNAIINDNIIDEVIKEQAELEHMSDEDSDFEPPEIQLSQNSIEDRTTATSNDKTTNEGKESEVKVKQEPIDIMQMLEELGSDYTTSIEIWDPFLVIDISSDESSDEEITVEGEDED